VAWTDFQKERKEGKRMDQQTWIITLYSDSVIETNQQTNELKELLQDISRYAQVTLVRDERDTQGGIGDTIVALLPSGVMIAAINAIKQFFLRNHGGNASIELELKEIKFKATGLNKDNYKHTLDELLKYAQTLKNEKKQ
jgi:hypothetical protein